MDTPANPEVERLVGCLMDGLQGSGQFTPSDGLSAVMTFAFRFCMGMVILSPTKDAREVNVKTITTALRIMAARVEFEETEAKSEKVH